jgi:hypothetical protein
MMGDDSLLSVLVFYISVHGGCHYGTRRRLMRGPLASLADNEN